MVTVVAAVVVAAVVFSAVADAVVDLVVVITVGAVVCTPVCLEGPSSVQAAKNTADKTNNRKTRHTLLFFIMISILPPLDGYTNK